VSCKAAQAKARVRRRAARRDVRARLGDERERQHGVSAHHDRRAEEVRQAQRKHHGGAVGGQQHADGLGGGCVMGKGQERAREQLGVCGVCRHTHMCAACTSIYVVCIWCAHHKGDVAHAQLRGERLDVVLAVALHIRQVLRTHGSALCGSAEQSPHAHTLVIAMTVAKSVTKQVMNVMAGLHCRRRAACAPQANGQHGFAGSAALPWP
jgi:hypothetical protein